MVFVLTYKIGWRCIGWPAPRCPRETARSLSTSCQRCGRRRPTLAAPAWTGRWVTYMPAGNALRLSGRSSCCVSWEGKTASLPWSQHPGRWKGPDRRRPPSPVTPTLRTDCGQQEHCMPLPAATRRTGVAPRFGTCLADSQTLYKLLKHVRYINSPVE